MNTGDTMNIKIKLELHEEFTCDDDEGELMEALFPNGTIKIENEVKKELREEFANEIDDNTNYFCELCKSYFPNLSSLQDHMQNHANCDEKNNIKSSNNSRNDALLNTEENEASVEEKYNEKPDKQEEKCKEKKTKRKRQRTEKEDDRISLENDVHENDKPELVDLIMKDHIILRIKHHEEIINKASIKTVKEETEDINENDNDELVNLIMKDHIILRTNNHAEKNIILKTEVSKETSRNSKCEKSYVHAETLDGNIEMNEIDAEYDDRNKKDASKDSNRKRRKKPVINVLAIESIPSQSQNMPNQLHCNLCKKSFDTSKKLKIHISNSHKRLSVFCDACSKKFSRKEYLDQHVKRDHLGMKQEWKCKFCGNIFTDNSNLRRHTIFYCTKNKRKVLGKDMKPIIVNKVGCEICRRKYVNQEALEAHMAQHPKYICDYCDKIYYIRRYLELHIKRHHLNMKYRCKKCGNEYVTGFNLYRHLKIHPHCNKKHSK